MPHPTRAMRALQALGVALSAATTEREVAEAVAEHVVDATEEGGACVVAVVRSECIEIVGERGLDDGAMARVRTFPFDADVPAAEAIRTRQPIWLSDRETFLARYPNRVPAAPDSVVQAVVAVPLPAGKDCIGALAMSFRSARAFDEEERGYILTFARICAQALDRVRHNEAARREAARLAVLVDAAKLFAEAGTALDEVLGRVAEKFAAVVGDSCSIWLLSDDGRYVDPMAVRYRGGLTPFMQSVFAARRRLATDEPTVRVLREGVPVRFDAADIQRILDGLAPEYRPIRDRWRPHAAVGVPLFVRGKIAGAVIMSRSTTPEPYTDEDIGLITALADHAALAYERMQLQAQERARRDEAERARLRAQLLADVAGALAETLDLDEMLRRMAGRVVPELCDAFVVDLADADGDLQQALVHPVERGSSSSAIVTPLIARGRLIGVLTFDREKARAAFDRPDLAFCQDLAARAALAIDNQRLLAETRAAVRLRDQFLSIASHELKTPVTALVLQLEAMRKALRNGGVEPIAGPWPDRIARQTKRLVRLVDDLLDVSRIESGRMKLDLDRCDLEELVVEVVARLHEQNATPIRVHAEQRIVGLWDRGRLDQVLTNLLVNALKYGGNGPIDVTLSRTGDRARLAVHDSGPGISAADQARIFEPFERGSGVKHGGGFGLGLFIVRSLVEAHGGNVRVESAPHAGTTFVVELGLEPTRSTP